MHNERTERFISSINVKELRYRKQKENFYMAKQKDRTQHSTTNF